MMRVGSCVWLLMAVLAFLPVTQSFTTSPSLLTRHHAWGAPFLPQQTRLFSQQQPLKDLEDNDNSEVSESKTPGTAAQKLAVGAATAWTFLSQAALANESPDWGLFEGRTGSLIHPSMMVSLLTFASWTAWLGFQWRRQRTLGDEISALKKSLPSLDGAATVQAALDAAKSAEAVDTSRVNALQAALPVEQQISDLQQERKDLSTLGPRDKHYSNGALLAFLGTSFAIEGCLNTFSRAGKLFPGPHLYAGAGLVCLWALAGACVPAMQKGNDTARTVHIGANVAGLGLFAWQVVSGVPILLKVIELTKWP